MVALNLHFLHGEVREGIGMAAARGEGIVKVRGLKPLPRLSGEVKGEKS